MSKRDRTLRKISGIVPDTPEFDILVRRTQLYRNLLSENVELREMLREAHRRLHQLRTTVHEQNAVLIQLKLAALGMLPDEAVKQVSEKEARAQVEAGDPEARPEERPLTPEAEH